MPIYAYRCATCGHAKDMLRKISDPALSACPACGADTFVKQVTAAGFQLKGSGWYVTDFRGDAKGAKKTEESGDGDGAKKDDSVKEPAKGDAVPAQAADAPRTGAGKAETPSVAAPAKAAAPAAPSAAGGGTAASGH